MKGRQEYQEEGLEMSQETKMALTLAIIYLVVAVVAWVMEGVWGHKGERHRGDDDEDYRG